MKTFILSKTFFLVLMITSLTTFAQTSSQVKICDFRMQSAHVVSDTPETLSHPGYITPVYWMPVKVPSTVLSALVRNKIYPDPYHGLNNMLIPDASDEFNRQYNLEKYSHLPGLPNPWSKPYWFRTEFYVPKVDEGRHFDLIFKGINYRAGVWLNGKQIADSSEMAGMFAEYRFDVSGVIIAGGKNALAVKIYPLDFPGLPDTEQLEAMGDFYLNGGKTGDIGKNVTMLCSVGWDWIPPVRDRNIGIWQPVYLRTSGKVVIENPKVITDLPALPDTANAEVSISFRVKNFSTGTARGRITVSLIPETFRGNQVSFTKEISLEPGASREISYNKTNTRELIIKNPVLWWPNGYGKPHLYRVTIRYYGRNEGSDEVSFLTGIRTVATKAVQVNGTWRRDFYVNGRRIHITGGAWVPDMMLNRDSMRYDYEFRLCRN